MHHTTPGSPPSVKRQKKHQHHVDNDEEEQDDKDHHPLGLRVHVAAEESVKCTPFVPASVGDLCHGFSPQEEKPKQTPKKTLHHHNQTKPNPPQTAPSPSRGAGGGSRLHTELCCSSQTQRSEQLDTAIAGPAPHVCQTPPPRPLMAGGC